MQNLLKWIRLLLSDAELDVIQYCPLYGPTGLRRYLASQSLHAFLDLYFADEFYLPLAPFQLDILKDCQEIRDRAVAQKPGVRLARALPRAHAKSSFYARILPLHGFLFNWSPLTVLLGNNDDAAKRLVGNIKSVIETNEAIVEDFPEFKGNYWGNEKLEAKTGAVITSFGIGSGSIRGVSTGKHRPALIIGDDLDDDKSVRSMVELANNKEWVDKSVLALGDNVSYTTSFIVIGTIIRKTSLLRYILDNPQFHSLTESAVQQFSNSALWEQWREQILSLARSNEQPKDASDDSFYQEHKAELLAGTQMLWNRPDAYRQAMLYRLANEQAFWSELQNTPKDSISGLNEPAFIQSPIDEREYDLLMFIDPSTTGNKTSDLAAVVELLYHRKRREVIVNYVDARQRSYRETIDDVAKRVKYRGKRYDGFWIETNAAGSIIAELMQARFNDELIPVQVNGYYSSTPKAEKINALSEYMNRGQLFFATDLGAEFEDEIYNWPVCRHDDVLDAIASGMHYLQERGRLNLVLLDTTYG